MFSDCDYQEKKMNYCVPDFETDDDCSLLSSSVPSRFKRSSRQEDDVMELLWQNGQVVMQNQTQKSMKKSASPSSSKFENSITADQMTIRDNRPSNEEEEPELFMQEDEMASWLHYQYPLGDDDPSLNPNLCSELLYQPPPQPQSQSQSQLQPHNNMDIDQSAAVTSRLPLPPARGTEAEEMMKVKDFGIFLRHIPRVESEPLKLKEQTVGESNGELRSGGGGVMEVIVGETASTGCSSAGAETVTRKPAVDNRKRKGKEKEKETDDNECHGPDVEFESTDPKKQVCGTTSTKRSRAAEVHNLSERKRRDRINEKMKALQELIPRCNKVDKASMLDEAIEYLKSLKMQVQMMSMGCSMVPMMFPGVQQFMPPMGMGLGMGMGMEMNVNRPMMPYPNMLAGSTFPRPAGAAHFGPSFSFPPFPMAHVPNTDPSRFQVTNQSDHTHSSPGMQNTNQPRGPSSLDAYQQFLGSRQMQVPAAGSRPAPQNQQAAPTGTSNQCTGSGRGLDSINHYQSG